MEDIRMNKNPLSPASASKAKYLNARLALLIVVITSLVTIVTVILNQTYFLFSAYITQLLMIVGYELTAESGDSLYLIVTVVLSVISVIPLLLCYIFSKKKVGWMIAALVIYGLDSLLFWGDFIAMLMYGEFSAIIDCIFRIYVIVMLVLAVKYGRQMAKEAAEAQSSAPAAETSEEYADTFCTQRALTVTRKKAFTGAAVAVVVFENGKEICRLKNGKTATVYVTGNEFELSAATTNSFVQGSAKVPAGETSLNYVISLKMGMLANSFVIEPARE